MAITYKVWVHIERIDERLGKHYDMGLPESIGEFDRLRDAEAFVSGIEKEPTSPVEPLNAVVEVSGGCVRQVYADAPMSVTLVDWDNIKAGGDRPDKTTCKLMARKNVRW